MCAVIILRVYVKLATISLRSIFKPTNSNAKFKQKYPINLPVTIIDNEL